MRLDRARAEAAIERYVARPLRLSPIRAAWGIHAVVNDSMARAARVHCLERGRDPREYVLLPYGGAGPVHAGQVAAALGMQHVLYPLRAGIMSAIGFLVSPASFECMRADIQQLAGLDVKRANAILAELEAEAQAVVRAAGVAARDCTVRREAGLRFAGQSFTLPVPMAPGPLSAAHIGALRKSFIKLYRTRYFRLNPDVPLELVHWRVMVSGPRPDLHLAPPERALGAARKGIRPAYFPEAGRYINCAVYDRFALPPERRIRGPALIEEPESTVVLGPGASAVLDRHANLMATLPAARRAFAAKAA